jgi:hypothetical protein
MRMMVEEQAFHWHRYLNEWPRDSRKQASAGIFSFSATLN